MKIVITGAGGFIGQHLIKHLYEKGHYVVGILNKPKATLFKGPYYFYNNLGETKISDNVVKNFDLMVMLAANVGGIGHITNKVYDVMKTNLMIDIHSIQSCEENNIENILYASTACVYNSDKCKNYHTCHLKESDVYPPMPDVGYGWAKLTTERILQASNFKYKLARLHTVYGRGLEIGGKREKVPVALCRKVAEATDSISIWGTGEQARTFLHIDDAVTALEKLINIKYVGAINIGHNDLVTIDQLADYIIEASGKNIRKWYDGSQPSGVEYRGTDISFASSLLNWKPKISVKTGIQDLYKWVNEQINK